MLVQSDLGYMYKTYRPRRRRSDLPANYWVQTSDWTQSKTCVDWLLGEGLRN